MLSLYVDFYFIYIYDSVCPCFTLNVSAYITNKYAQFHSVADKTEDKPTLIKYKHQ